MDGLAFEEPKERKPLDGGCRYPHLGFLLDEALSGSPMLSVLGAICTHKSGLP